MDYQSWRIPLAGSETIAKKVYFKSSKKELKLSQWIIIVQYEYVVGDPAPSPPPITLGVLINIVGTANGISGILNEVSGSQTWVPIVGATYRAYGSEIQVGFGNDGGDDVVMLLSAVEDPQTVIDGESRLADASVAVAIPQFATSFSVLVAGDFKQMDFAGSALGATVPLVPGQFYPIHPLAYFIIDIGAQPQVYAFKKGYT